jgi:hypothetical protein
MSSKPGKQCCLLENRQLNASLTEDIFERQNVANVTLPHTQASSKSVSLQASQFTHGQRAGNNGHHKS